MPLQSMSPKYGGNAPRKKMGAIPLQKYAGNAPTKIESVCKSLSHTWINCYIVSLYKGEAIWIRKTDNMNRDEGSYQLSHVWDKLLHTDDRYRKSVLMKTSDVKSKRR